MANDLNGLYQQYFGRDGDASGMAYWQNELNSGKSFSDIQSSFENIAKDYTASPTKYDQSVTSKGYTPQQTGMVLDQKNGTYNGMSWDDLSNQVMSTRLKNYEGDYLDSGYLNNKPAQIRQNPDGTVSSINYYGVDSRPGYNVMLSKGTDGKVSQQWYKEDNSIPWGAILMMAGPFAQAVLGAGAAAGASTSLADTMAASNPNWLSEMAANGMGPTEMSMEQLTEWAASQGIDPSLAEVMAQTNPDWLKEVAENGMGPEGLSDLSTIPVDGVDQFQNEADKLLRQNAAEPGSILNTTPVTQGGLPTVNMDGKTPYVEGLPKGGTYTLSDGTTLPTGPTTTIPKILPPVKVSTDTGTKTGTKTTTGTGGLDLGTLLGLLYGAHSKNAISNQLSGLLDQITGMYKPGSPEALQMKKEIEARDAAHGRRSQYGPREVELAGKLASARMNALTSPGFMTMQAAMMNNNLNSGGLSEILAALSKNGGIPGLNFNLSDLSKLFNSGSPEYITGGDAGDTWNSGYDL